MNEWAKGRAVQQGFSSLRCILLCLFLVGCSGQSAAQNAEGTKPNTEISVIAANVPSDFNVPIPFSVAGLERWKKNARMTARSHFVDGVISNDVEAFARLQSAATDVAASEQAQWSRRVDSLFEFATAHPSTCERLRPIMQGPGSALRDSLAGLFADSCAKPADFALMTRPDVPSYAVIKFHGRLDDVRASAKYSPMLARAVATEASDGSEFVAFRGARIMAEHEKRGGVVDLVALVKSLPAGKKRDDLTMALFDVENAEARKLVAEVCHHNQRDIRCKKDQKSRLFAHDESMTEATTGAGTDQKPMMVLVSRMEAMGFGPFASALLEEVYEPDASMILLAAGKAHWFDVETGMFPNEHDRLLRTLASLNGGVLNSVIFEEIPPSLNDDSESAVGPYKIRAYANGQRYETEAADYGDWYDVDAVLRLLNKVATDMKTKDRYYPLKSEDQTLIIVSAPPAAFHQAVQTGILTPGESAEARNIGKGYEEEVLRKIQGK